MLELCIQSDTAPWHRWPNGTIREPAALTSAHPLVCSVWQADHGAAGVRLITAYPA